MLLNMETITEKLTYRIYEDKDLDGVLDLWEQYSGWGAITREQFETWHFKTPLGSCLIIVAVNEFEKIIGQIVFSPSIISINGKEERGYRASAPIVNPEYRQLSINHIDHPVIGMIKFGTVVGRERGFKLVYTFPAQGWVTLLKAFPKYGLPTTHIALYDCFSLSLNGKEYQPSNCKINTSQKLFSQEYDALWNEASIQLPIACAVKRSATWLKWKISDYLVFEARCTHFNKLIGYIAIDKKSGLIIDMLARTKEDLNGVIKSTIYYLHISNPSRYPLQLNKLKGMLTPYIKAVLQDILFENEPFTFAFGCYPLQDSISLQEIHPLQWYMMPKD